MGQSKQMTWKDIKVLELVENHPGLLPVRMLLRRIDGSVVTSGGVSIADAAVVLFSTAGLGRFPPKILAKKLFELFTNRLHESPYPTLIKKLAEQN